MTAGQDSERPVIRQNPPVRTETAAGGEFCPDHGIYQAPYGALQTRRQATSPGVSAPRAWRLLEHAERLRRTCPRCGGVAPSLGRWATRIRCAVAETKAAVAEFAPRCNFCAELLPADDPTNARHRCAP